MRNITLFLTLILCLFFTPLSYGADPAVQASIASLAELDDKSQSNLQLQAILENNSPDILTQIEIWTLIAKNHHTLSDFNSAIQAASNARQLAQSNGLPVLEADANKLIGVFNYFSGNLDASLSAYEASYQYFIQVDEPIKQANLLNNIGLVYTVQNRFSLALVALQAADPIYQKFGDEFDKVDIKFNIAGLHIDLEQYDVAIRMLKEVIVKRTQLKAWHDVALAKNDLGIAYKKSGQYKLAEQVTLEAYQEVSDLDDHYRAAGILSNLSGISNNMGKPLKAKEYALRSLEQSLQYGHQLSYSGGLYDLAVALFQLGDTNDALEYLNKSEEISKEQGYKKILNDIKGLHSLISASKQDHRKAFLQHLEYEQSIFRNSNKLMNEQLARFNAEKLTQQVNKLEKDSQLQMLRNRHDKQVIYFSIVAFLLLTTMVFFIYRRNVERKTKISLSSQVKQRTAQLQKLAEELRQANKIKSQFLANMSHEIRTPLTAIIGQSEAIGFDEVPADLIKSEVEVIHQNSQHLLQLVNDILDLSKIEADRFEIEVSSYNLIESVHELQNMFDEQATKKGLTFTIEYLLPMPMMINVDSFRLNQILFNLCSNAVKFTNTGEIYLKIEKVNDNLVFQVSDTGIGMIEAHMQKVFSSFSQADNSISRQYGGTGLGLFLSAKLAVMLGGDLKVDSIINKGSIFTLSIPYSKAEMPEKTTDSESIESWSLPPDSQLTGQVILADDYRDNRHLIGRLLSAFGLEVLYAENGLEVIELYLQHQPQIILLDIQMPEMDGIQAFNKLRTLGCRLPIYALTANAMAHEIKEYLQIGFTGHLKKPLERKELFQILNTHLEQQPTSRLSGQVEVQQQPIEPKKVDMSDLALEFNQGLLKEQQEVITLMENADLPGLQAVVHRIAGASAMFGVAKLSELALQVETDIKNKGVYLASAQLLLEEFDKINSK